MASIAVVDASALVELLTRRTALGDAVAAELAEPDWIAPQGVDIEVLGALRRLESRGQVPPRRADAAVHHLMEAPIDRIEISGLLPTMWSLRANLSAGDSAYVAVAALYGCPLITVDARLKAPPALPVEIICVRG